jgi:hypothetical protein
MTSQAINSSAKDWNNANSAFNSVVNEYKQEIQCLYKMSEAGNPGLALWLFQTQCMPMATQSCQYSMQKEADALNIANELRNAISNVQNAYNNVINDIENGNSGQGVQDAAALSNALKKLSGLVNNTDISQILSKSNISTINGFIKTISGALYGPPAWQHRQTVDTSPHQTLKHSVWQTWSWEPDGTGGLTQYTYTTSRSWNTMTTHPVTKTICYYDNGGIYDTLKSFYNEAVKNGQPVPPQFTTITSNFNQLNQMISGVSSSIQMQMQYLNQNLQQFFGIYKSFFDDYSQLSSYVIQKTNSQ